jgi:hypothetical protein
MGKATAADVGHVNQPSSGWIDAKDNRDATFHVLILYLAGEPEGALPKLVIETASSAAGPWLPLEDYQTIATFPENSSFGASTGATGGAEKQLERFFAGAST